MKYKNRATFFSTSTAFLFFVSCNVSSGLSSSTRNRNVALDKRKFSYHSWSENSFNASWNHAPVLGSCHMVLSMVHWLIMKAIKRIGNLKIFLLRFLLKRFNVSAEFSPEKGVTLLLKGNGERVAAIMAAMFLSFAHPFVYLPLSDKERYRRLKQKSGPDTESQHCKQCALGLFSVISLTWLLSV